MLSLRYCMLIIKQGNIYQAWGVKNSMCRILSVMLFAGIFSVSLDAQNTTQPVNTAGANTVSQQKPNSPFAACTDMGGESGWGGWKAVTGIYSVDNTPSLTALSAPGNASAPRFRITGGTGVDACTQGGGGPPIPVVAPGFGTASILLGEPEADGNTPPPCAINGNNYGCVEQLRYPLTVSAQGVNFKYAYAIVVENPLTPPHKLSEAPFAEIYILDPKGDTVPCSHKKYIGDINGAVAPGFYTASCNSNFDGVVTYRPWTTVGINLTPYIGQTLNVVITNSDCSRAGHFCHSYWDFSCGPLDPITLVPVCSGQAISITAPANPNPPPPFTYAWFQNGKPYTGPPGATAQTITPIPLPGDTFSVIVSQAGGCPFEFVYVPQTNGVPVTATATPAGCSTANGTASVTNGQPGYTYSWSTTPKQTTQTATGLAPGTYSVLVTSTGGCTSTATVNIAGSNSPVVTITSSNALCKGGTGGTATANVTAGGTPPYTYLWSDGQITQTASGLATGNYTVLVTDSKGCTSSAVQSITSSASPVASFTTAPVCFNNKPTAFKDLSAGNATISSWQWDFGDGTGSTQQDPSHLYGQAGTFTVKLVVTNSSGCKDSIQAIAVVNPVPIPSFSFVAACKNDSACFSDLSSITPGSLTNWSWNFGDPGSGPANVSAVKNPCHIFNGPGPYSVLLTVTSDSGCQSTVTLPVTVNPAPVAQINPQNVCLNATTQFTDGSASSSANDPISVWNWNLGDGNTSAQQNPAHTYTAPGTYSVTLAITSQKGCKDTTTSVAVVYALPVANYSDSVRGCVPVCSTLKDLSLPGSGSITSWQWSFPGGTPPVSASANPTICWNSTGVYGASLVVTSSYGCKDTLSTPKYINVYPWPAADFCVAPSLAPTTHPVFTFCDAWSADVVKWNWDFGDNTNDTISTDPVHSYSASATQNDFYTFPICIRVQNQYGCWDTACHSVELIPEFTFYIPNSFTPNGDGINDMFYGKCRGVKEYSIRVFDRWGNQVWDCDYKGKNTDWDKDNSGQEGMASYCKWNGKVVPGGADMNGKSNLTAQEDVYVWKVKLTDIFDKSHVYTGHVTLVQ